jgi:hypothetical protein
MASSSASTSSLHFSCSPSPFSRIATLGSIQDKLRNSTPHREASNPGLLQRELFLRGHGVQRCSLLRHLRLAMGFAVRCGTRYFASHVFGASPEDLQVRCNRKLSNPPIRTYCRQDQSECAGLSHFPRNCIRPARTSRPPYLFIQWVCYEHVSGSLLGAGGSQVVSALTGANVYASCFLIPLVVGIYVIAGGLRSTFIADYAHTVILFFAIFVFGFTMYATSNFVGRCV